MVPPFAIGIVTVSCGCLSSAIGFLLMKRSGEVEADVPCSYRAWPRMDHRLLLLVAVLQTVCDAVSLTLLPLSVVAPFAGLTIVAPPHPRLRLLFT